MTTEFSVMSEPDDENRWRYIVASGRWTYSEAEAERLAGKLAALQAEVERLRELAKEAKSLLSDLGFNDLELFEKLTASLTPTATGGTK